MTLSKKGMLSFGRGTVIAVAIVGMSGALEAAGLPICSAIGRITQNFAAAQSEAKRMREKATRVAGIREQQSPGIRQEQA